MGLLSAHHWILDMIWNISENQMLWNWKLHLARQTSRRRHYCCCCFLLLSMLLAALLAQCLWMDHYYSQTWSSLVLVCLVLTLLGTHHLLGSRWLTEIGRGKHWKRMQSVWAEGSCCSTLHWGTVVTCEVYWPIRLWRTLPSYLEGKSWFFPRKPCWYGTERLVL